MNKKFEKVHYDKPTKIYYLKKILWAIFSFRLFIDLGNLLAYYIVNYVLGRKSVIVGDRKSTRLNSSHT